MKKLVVIGFIFLYHSVLYCAFEECSGSASSIGMGEAIGAVGDNNDSVFYNCAALGRINRMSLSTSYGGVYLGLKDGSVITDTIVSFSYPFVVSRLGTVNFTIKHLSLTGLYNETLAGIYYGKHLMRSLYIGTGVKLLNLSYGRDEYTSINPVFRDSSGKNVLSLDFGILQYITRTLVLGVAMMNVNQPDIGIKYNDPLPLKFIFSGGYNSKFIKLATDINIQKNTGIILNCGLEKGIYRYFKFRAGVGIGDKNYLRISAGAGYNWKNLFIDYGMSYPVGSLVSYGIHKFSVGLLFGEQLLEDIERIESMFEGFKVTVINGEYNNALKIMKRIVDEAPDEKKYQSMLNRITVIASRIPEETASVNESVLLRKGIEKYLLENDINKSIEFLLYIQTITSDKDKRIKIGDILKFISEESGVKIPVIPTGLTLVDYKLHQSLEHFINKQYPECIKLCEEVLELEPQNITAYKRIGSSYYMLNDIEKAIQWWNKSIQLAPEDEENIKIKATIKKLKKK